MEGIGEDFIPDIADMSLVKRRLRDRRRGKLRGRARIVVAKKEFSAARHGDIARGCAPLLPAADHAEARRHLRLPTLETNISRRCTTTFWMAEQGFVERPTQGDLSDLISHRAEQGEVITVGPDDTLLTALKRMRGGDVSQLPVLNGAGRAVGIIDESDLVMKVTRDPAKFNELVKTAMTDRLETLSPAANISDLLGVFDRGRVAIIMESATKFLGLITRTDLLSYLRLQMPK